MYCGCNSGILRCIAGAVIGFSGVLRVQLLDWEQYEQNSIYQNYKYLNIYCIGYLIFLKRFSMKINVIGGLSERQVVVEAVQVMVDVDWC